MNDLATLSVADYRETTEAIREAAADAMRAADTLEQHAERLELIRSSKMYEQDGFKNWGEYCRKGLGITKQHANRQIRSADVMKRLQVEHMCSTKPNARQAEALSQAPPDEQAEVWSEVVEEHGEKVTAAKVAEAVEKRKEAERPEPPVADPIDAALADPWWQDACRSLAKIGKQLDERFHDQLLQPHLESFTGRVLRDLKSVRSTLRAATPTERCGKCSGKGCVTCLQTGLLVYGQVRR